MAQLHEGADPMVAMTSILRLPDVEARCAVNRRTLYYWIERGLFPRPISLGPRTVGWLDRDIEAWINEKAQASRVGPAGVGDSNGGPNA
jgi:prophage regulatory protein